MHRRLPSFSSPRVKQAAIRMNSILPTWGTIISRVPQHSLRKPLMLFLVISMQTYLHLVPILDHFVGHVWTQRLLLFGRVADKKGPSSIQTWVQGQDMFFINCARRWMKRDGYIAVKQNDEEEWITCCVARRSSHDDTNTFLLFRLLPASYRDNPELFAAQQGNIAATGVDKVLFNGHDNVQSLDKQLEQYGKGPAPEAFRAPLSLLTQQWSAIPGSREIN